MPTSLLDSLNEQQLEIATADPCDMFVVAGAGTGKTKVLISRVAYLVSTQECKPWQILAVTFTNKAAEEMRTRLTLALGWDDDDVKSLVVTTFHGLCNKILHRHAIEAGLPSEFSIITTSDQKTLLKRIYTQYGIKNNESYGDLKDGEVDLRTVLNRINQDKQKDISPAIDPKVLKAVRASLADNWESYSSEELYQILFACYCQECETSSVLDFNDLLNRTKKLLLENSSIRQYYTRRFKYIFIDEFQDTNTIQYQIVMLIKNQYNHLMVVGDDDQGIYAWRGADIANLQRIERDLPNINKHELTINYRSTQNILNFANAIIAYNSDRIIEKFLTAPDIYKELSKADLQLLLSLPKDKVIEAIKFVCSDETGSVKSAAHGAIVDDSFNAGSELLSDDVEELGASSGITFRVEPYSADYFKQLESVDGYHGALEQMTPSMRKMVIEALIFNHTISDNKVKNRIKHTWQLQQKDTPLVNIVRCSSDAAFVSRVLEILQAKGYEYKDVAVLYRNNSLSSPIESMLLNSHIPYQIYGGTKFYERSEIVLVLCYLRLMVNPKDDIAFEQVLNVPRRGMGEAYLQKIKLYARTCGLSCYEALSMAFRSGDRSTTNAFKKAIPFYELIESLKKKMYTTKLPDLIKLVISESGLDEYFMSLDTKEHSARFGVSRMDNIEQLIINAEALQEKPTSNLNELALRIEDALIGDDGTEISSYEAFLQSIRDDDDAEPAPAVAAIYTEVSESRDSQDESNESVSGLTAIAESEGLLSKAQKSPVKAVKATKEPFMNMDGHNKDHDGDAKESADHAQVLREQSKIVLDDGTEISQFDLLLNFISGVALISSAESNEKGQNGVVDDNSVKLMTIHSAKGLEFKAVICVGFEENILPSRLNKNIEEERRLAYVAVTRAKQELFVGYCLQRSSYGYPAEKVHISRFIEEAVGLLKDMGTKPYAIKKVN